MMRKTLLAISLFLCTCAAAQFREDPYAGLDDTESVSAMREHISYLSSAAMEGRKAGSPMELDAARYISGVLASYGVDVLSGPDGDLFGMKMESGDTLRSRNVFGFIPGYDAKLKDHYIVIGARMDNLGTRTYTLDGVKSEKIFYGANGNASGVAMLLELAKRLSTNKVLLKRSIIIAGFGSSLQQQAGSWYFLNRSFPDAGKIDAMINLDMVGTGSTGFYAYTSSNQDMNDVLHALSGTLQPVQPELVAYEPVSSDHRQFYAMEIPSVFFTTGMYPEYNTEKDTESIIEYDDMDRELEYVYNFSVKLANGPKPAFSRSVTKPKVFAAKDIVPYYECDRRPTFLNSSDPSVFLKRWVYVYLRYPQKAIDNGIQGRVLVNFVIDEKGKVRDVTVERGVDPLLDDEAVRVIEASPDWKPARVNGEKVKCSISLYVEFRLEKKRR